MNVKQSLPLAEESQTETDSAIRIRLEPVTSVYPEENGTYVLSRTSKFRLNFEHDFESLGVEVSIVFSALNNELYGSFPLHLYVYVNGLNTEIVTLESEFEYAITRFRVARPCTLHVNVYLKNRLLPQASGDIRFPAFRLMKVMAKCVAEDAAPYTATYVPASGLQSEYVQDNFYNYEASSTDPIFVIGSPRSGTSILTWSIGTHPNIYSIEETNFFPLLTLSALANYKFAGNSEKSLIQWFDVDRNSFMQAHGEMMRSLIMKACDAQHRYNCHLSLAGTTNVDGVRFTLSRSPEDSKRRWVDGAPINTSVSYLLSMMYPKAKFIHIFRYPVKVIASLMNFDKVGGVPLSYEAARDEWISQVRFGRLLEIALGPERVLSLQFEQLIGDPAESMRTIFRFLGEPHYEAAKNTFRARINSSAADMEFLENLYRRLQTDERWPQMLSLYEGTLSSEPTAAMAELVDIINDIGCKILKTVFGHEYDSVF